MSNLRNEIISKGCLEIDFPSSLPLAELANAIGSILPQGGNDSVILKPQEANSNKNSLSSRFGYGDFPLHTDGVALAVPPEIVLMRSLADDQSQQPTIIGQIGWPSEGSHGFDILSDNPVYLHTGKAIYLTYIMNRRTHYREAFVRYNPCCIKIPDVTTVITNTLNYLLENAVHHEINWQNGKIVAIHNWKTLHGRGRASHGKEHGDRVLERCWVK